MVRISEHSDVNTPDEISNKRIPKVDSVLGLDKKSVCVCVVYIHIFVSGGKERGHTKYVCEPGATTDKNTF